MADSHMEEINLRGTTNRAYSIDDDIKEFDMDSTKTEPRIDNGSLHALSSSKISNERKKTRLKKILVKALILLLHVAVAAYFAYATYYHIYIENNECNGSKSDNPLCGMKFCSGYGFFVVLFGFVYFCLFYYFVLKPKIGRLLYKQYLSPFNKWWLRFSRQLFVSLALIALLIILLIIFLYFETRNEVIKLKSLIAPCFFVLLGYICSSNRQAIKWRTVITGMTCQFLLGVFCIRWEVGRNIFDCIGKKVATFLGFADEGSRFVYGDILILDNAVFAFAVLSVIYFFSFFISILNYLGAMQWVVMKLGWSLQQLLGTTVCESVIAAANIFLGMSESPLLIRPYIKLLTASELHTIMVSGFATVSGSVLAAYLSFGASAAHLITSSVMAAPAALAISKLYYPETEKSKTSSDNIQLEKTEDSSLLDAASNGASNATPLVLGIIANIIAFVAFVAFLNAVVNWFGYLVGLDDIDFEWIFSKLFVPLAYAMGIENKDVFVVAKIVAKKTIVNEFVAYQSLGEYTNNNTITARSAGITTFAICGFANPSSLGILIGALSVMAPSRRALITSVALRAVVVGSIVCFVSASFAGLLIQEEEESRIYQNIFEQLERKNNSIV